MVTNEPDLVDVEAIYHHKFYVTFSQTISNSAQKKGRSKVNNVSDVMKIIFKHIELLKRAGNVHFQ